MGKARLRAIFFDLDDTLCDTIGTREARAQIAFEAIARDRPELTREWFVGKVMEPTGERLVRGVPAMVEQIGLTCSEAGRAAIGAWFFNGCIGLLCAFEGVAETIDGLRDDYKLGVITNGSAKFQRAKWLQLNLGIDLVVISEECGFEKPDQRIFRHACTLAGVPPREAAIVGDRLDVDIAGSKAAGMRAIWFNHWNGSHEGVAPAPDAVIERFDELPAALANIAKGEA